MNEFLDRIANRTLGLSEALMPRVPSVFEPHEGQERMVEEEVRGGLNHEEIVEPGWNRTRSNPEPEIELNGQGNKVENQNERPPFVPPYSQKNQKLNREPPEGSGPLNDTRRINSATTEDGSPISLSISSDGSATLKDTRQLNSAFTEDKAPLSQSIPSDPERGIQNSDVTAPTFGIQSAAGGMTPHFSLPGREEVSSEKGSEKSLKIQKKSMGIVRAMHVGRKETLQEEAVAPGNKFGLPTTQDPTGMESHPTHFPHQPESAWKPIDTPSSRRPEPNEVPHLSDSYRAESPREEIEAFHQLKGSIKNIPEHDKKQSSAFAKDIQAMKTVLGGMKRAMQVKPSTSESTVHVSIGRVEVKAMPEQSSTRKTSRAKPAVMPLQDYLAFRGEGKIG